VYLCATKRRCLYAWDEGSAASEVLAWGLVASAVASLVVVFVRMT
jgi:hypothetical protein